MRFLYSCALIVTYDQTRDLCWEDILRYADKALYHAKHNGRNRGSAHEVGLGAVTGRFAVDPTNGCNHRYSFGLSYLNLPLPDV